MKKKEIKELYEKMPKNNATKIYNRGSIMENDFNYRPCTGYNIVCNDSYVPDDMPFLIWKDKIYVRKELYDELKKLPKNEYKCYNMYKTCPISCKQKKRQNKQ